MTCIGWWHRAGTFVFQGVGLVIFIAFVIFLAIAAGVPILMELQALGDVGITEYLLTIAEELLLLFIYFIAMGPFSAGAYYGVLLLIDFIVLMIHTADKRKAAKASLPYAASLPESEALPDPILELIPDPVSDDETMTKND